MLFEQVKLFVENSPHLAAFYLILGKTIGSLLFFPGTPLTLLAGATLGVFWGSVVSIIGNTLGAVLSFLVSRFFLRKYVEKHIYKKYKKIKDYEDRFFRNGFLTVITLRLIPLFPFNALNYLLGITKVKTKDYILGTFLGIIPGTIAFVYFGEALARLSVLHIVFSVLAILLLIILGKFYEKR